MELLISSMRFSAAYDYPFYDCSSLHNYILHLTLQYISIQETSTVSDHIHFFVPSNMYDDVAVRKIFFLSVAPANQQRARHDTPSAVCRHSHTVHTVRLINDTNHFN